MYYNMQIRMQSFTENKENFRKYSINGQMEIVELNCNNENNILMVEFLKRQAKPEWHGVFIRSLKIIIRNN